MRGRGAIRGNFSGSNETQIGSLGGRSVQTMLQSACTSGVLRLANKQLSEFPAAMFNLSDIDYQNKKWWEEQDISTIDASHNLIAHFPDEFSVYSESLKVLVASYNQLKTCTPVATLKWITRLDLSHNQLAPDSMAALGDLSQLTQLQELDLSFNKLQSLSGLSQLPSLKSLNATANQLTGELHSGSSAAPHFPALRSLLLSQNAFTSMPTACFFAKELIEIDLSQCNIASLLLPQSPPCFAAQKLVTLNVRRNKLSTMPEFQCPQLKELTIGENNITELPKNFARGLPLLSILDVSGNKLTSVDALVGLDNLTRADLRNNDLSSLPPKLSLAKGLTSIVLDGNPLRGLRREIVQKGTVEILKYLRSRLDMGDNDDIAPDKGSQLAAIAQKASSGGKQPVAITLGERNAACWNLALPEGRGRNTAAPVLTSQIPPLPNELTAQLIASAAPATNQVAAGCTSLKLMNQSKLEVVDASFLAMFNGELLDVDVSGTAISAIDVFLNGQCCPKIQSFSASRCKLSGALSPTCCMAASLTRLDLSQNALTGLCDQFVHYAAKLQYLNLNNNRLKSFPMCCLQLPNLYELQLSGNAIETLPEVIGPPVWPCLQLLDVSNNELTTVPFAIGCMQKTLRTFKVEGNRIRWLRQATLEKGTGAILEFLRDKIPK